tara:strand:- start:623 stop:736 length:114 start_codon:yes stop_codon:yes gene_type:complete
LNEFDTDALDDLILESLHESDAPEDESIIAELMKEVL